MNKTNKIKLGISIGDFNGIGIEVVLKTFQDKRMLDFCTPIVFGNTKLLSAYKSKTNIATQINGLNEIEKAVPNKLNSLNIWKDDVKLKLGIPTKQSGKYAFKSLEAATNALVEGKIDVLVTAPISKDNIQSEEFNFAGHTEYLDAKIEGDSLMILMTNEIKIGLITGHIPISQVSQTITPELIKSKVQIMHKALIEDFGINKPKIALLSLNPHCGDNGVIGNEDAEVVKPTIEEIKNNNCLVFGPYAADSFFGTENYRNFDGVLAMYHDQGLAPFKTLAFGGGVNYTAGLEAIRTSPDHGTAYEIAGKNKANFNSFREAVFAGIKIFETRKQYKELVKNVLKPVDRK